MAVFRIPPLPLAIFALVIALLFKSAVAQPSKKAQININISGSRPSRTKISASEDVEGGMIYTVQTSSKHTHILGSISDSGELIIEGDDTAMSRLVLVVPRDDGSKYIRVTTRHRINGHNYKTSIDEFLRRSGAMEYQRIERQMVDIDLLTQRSDRIIHLELVVDWEEHERNLPPGASIDDVPRDLEHMPIRYTVQKEAQYHFSIGTVHYGDFTIEEETKGLVERTILWKGGEAFPIVVVESYYKDGTWARKEYMLSNQQGKGFSLHNIRGGITPISR